VIKDLLADKELDVEKEEERKRKRDGSRYFKAIEEFGLDMGEEVIVMRQSRPTSSELQLLATSLLKTVKF
jgi:hypothetical protein